MTAFNIQNYYVGELTESHDSANQFWLRFAKPFSVANTNWIILFPVRLDDAVMETDQAWSADVRGTRHIGDFTQWKNHGDYHKAFDQLMRDLKT